MIKEVQGNQLRLGMCVCGIGKSSADSSYHHNKFLVQDQSELEYLLALSEVFYIDTTQGADIVDTCSSPSKETAYHFQAYLAFLHQLNGLYASLRREKALEFEVAKTLTQELMGLVIQDPASMMACCWEMLDQTPFDELSRKSLNVAIFSLALGWHLGLSSVEVFNLGLGALLHDMGITQVPEAILNKQASLSDGERAIMEQHTVYGLKLLANLKSVPVDVKKIVYHHHERIDGQGYPGKLKGEGIDLSARLVGMVSVFEALTRDRVYCRGLSPEQAMHFLHVSGDTLFDRRLIEQFIRVLGVYPEGTVVELSTGHLACVVEVDPEDRFAPKLKLLTDEHKNLLDEWAFIEAQPQTHADAQILKLVGKDEPILPFLHVYLEQCS